MRSVENEQTTNGIYWREGSEWGDRRSGDTQGEGWLSCHEDVGACGLLNTPDFVSARERFGFPLGRGLFSPGEGCFQSWLTCSEAVAACSLLDDIVGERQLLDAVIVAVGGRRRIIMENQNREQDSGIRLVRYDCVVCVCVWVGMR